MMLITLSVIGLQVSQTQDNACHGDAVDLPFVPRNNKEFEGAVHCTGTKSVYGPFGEWNVSQITNMSGAFECNQFFNDGDISKWDVSNVNDMSRMFMCAISFNGDLSKWNVSGVTNMSATLCRATSFNNDISTWNVSNVINMHAMFSGAALYNNDMYKWDVSGVTDMSSMFDNATSFTGDISNWNVSSVIDMNSMFLNATSFNNDISKWNVSRVTDMHSMFDNATTFSCDLMHWRVSAVTNMKSMFNNAISFNGDISKWDVSSVKDMSMMFKNARVFNSDISNWDVSRVEDMYQMFYGASSFARILCGTAWVDSKAAAENKDTLFVGSGSATISPVCIWSGHKAEQVVFIVVLAALVAAVAVLLTLYCCLRRRGASPLQINRTPSSAPSADTDTNAVSLLQPAENDRDAITVEVGDARANVELTRFPHSSAESSAQELRDRTFAHSNYKRFYLSSKAALFQHELLGAVHNMLKLFAIRNNPSLDGDTVAGEVNMYMEKIQDDAFRNNKDLKHDVSAVAEYLWTSAKTHHVVKGMELCSVLNAVIRDDIAEEIAAATKIFRSINSRRVHRAHTSDGFVDPSYPRNGETWRGGGFRRECRAFFERIKGGKYRVPGFLATSQKKHVAAAFAHEAGKTRPCAMWRVMFDPRGKTEPEHRVQHMSLVQKSLIRGECEYLFAPYSVFTMVSVEWSEQQHKPHQFTIRPAVDNKIEDESLPLAPWY